MAANTECVKPQFGFVHCESQYVSFKWLKDVCILSTVDKIKRKALFI